MSHRRSANTCAECRARKVKCDGRRVICTPCERLHLRCSFERVGDETFADPDPEATRGKRRAKAACQACQASKIRCSGELPHCRRCTSKAQTCVYSASKRYVPRKDPSATPQSHTTDQESGSHAGPMSSPRGQTEIQFAMARSASNNVQETSPSKMPVDVASVSPLLDGPLIMRMFDSFFQYLQPMPIFSCFHKVSLIQRFEAGLLNPGLILAIIGTTCDMLDMGHSMKELGRACLVHAEKLVMKDIGTPSAVKIQAFILIIKAHLRQNHLMQAFVLFGIASRFAFALKLNHEAPKLCFLEQESRRRLMWSLYIVDSSLSGGIREFSLCPAESIYIQLPCQERNFEFDLQQVTESLQSKMDQQIPDSIGSLGMYIRVCWLRFRILQTTKEAVLSQDSDIGYLPARLDQLAMDLANYEASLPDSFKFSKRNLQLRAYSPRVCPYLMIHIWLRQCHCDLYRVVLTGLKEALREDQIQQLHPSVVMYYRWKCYESAEKLADVLESVCFLKEGLFSLDTTIPICAYQCVRLLLQCFRQCDRTHGIITGDTLSRLIQQCVRAVEVSPLTSTIEKRIGEDLQQLLQLGRSAPPSPDRETSPTQNPDRPHAPVVSARSHLFSRHSWYEQSTIQDDSADLTMRDNQVVEASPSTESPSQVPRAFAETGIERPQRLLGQFEQTEMADLASFNVFQGDMGELFDLDSSNLDLFGWSGDYWADPA